jgi:MoxR-like ATPase
MRQKETRLTDIKSELQIDNATLVDWKSCCENVELPDSILEAITHIRHGLRQLGKRENVEPLDFYISDRRWKKAANLLRTSAFLNDRTEVDMSDIVLLQHVLWNKVECIRPVTQLVLESLFADIQKSMTDLSKEMQKAPEENARKTEGSNRNAFQVYQFFYAKLLPPTNAKQTNTVYFLLNNYEQLSLSKPSDGIIYYDDNLKGFVVRKMDVKMSAEQLRSIQNLTVTENRPMAVKLKRGTDSIFIDNKEYQLEKAKFGGSLLGTNNLINKQYVPNLANLHFEESAYAIRTKFEERKSLLLAKNGNLFINNTDTTNLKRYCQNLEKAINALEVKVNTLKTKQ